jgi:hypothetical protein
VLGTVQGAALRSARAYARPSGLDGACAQMIVGQLRDGRRMLFPSGTHGALIDPLDALRKRSRVFDRSGYWGCTRSLRFIFLDFGR